MPRDVSFRDLGEVRLGGGRRGRVIETPVAGEFAVQVAACWVDRLYTAGHLDTAERDAAAVLHRAFEASAIRPRLTGAYDGAAVDGSDYTGGLLETLGRSEMQAWRRCNHLLDQVPGRYRSQVRAVALWDVQPWNVPELRLGLRALSAALRQLRRR